jgi:hypothetical protein
MKRNYKLQITNYKQITNYNVRNYKQNGVLKVDQGLDKLIINFKGGHGLHEGSFRLQIMTAFNQKFLRGSRGRFLQKEPPGKEINDE